VDARERGCDRVRSPLAISVSNLTGSLDEAGLGRVSILRQKWVSVRAHPSIYMHAKQKNRVSRNPRLERAREEPLEQHNAYCFQTFTNQEI
jgi:hypothetical protein